jgi:hypothetical protein
MWDHSAHLPHDFHGLRVDCVSRPGHEDFPRFLNNHCHFDADCVSRRVPDNFRERVAVQRLARPRRTSNALAHSTLAVVVGVLLVPARARATMPRALALCSTARSLPLARPPVRLEPLAALTTRTLATHPCSPPEKARSVPRKLPQREVARAFSAARAVGQFSRANPGHFSRAVKR